MNLEKDKWYQKSAVIIVLLVIFFPIGLYLMWKYANWDNKIKWGVTGLLSLLLIANRFSEGSKPQAAATTSVAQSQTISPSPTPSPTPSAIAFEFDIPSLIGKNLDGVIAVLGKPDKNAQPTPTQIQLGGVKDWDEQFTVNGHSLLVNYTIADRSIINFFLETDDPSGKTTDTKRLLALGNLKEKDPKYKVEFVKTFGDSNSFTGVKVTPN
ncbi:hypothetical protein HY024_00480 [Candidatus Curtissbacteria bacterium]|nr:hypothetical protein [Candidatus Curtissbacteria bacterium]